VNSTIQSIDAESLAIIDLIKKYFETLSIEVGPVGNIFIVFMHDLAVHFSGILMHRKAVEHYSDVAQFPWVNKMYALSPYPIVDSVNIESSPTRDLKLWLRQLSLSYVALGPALPFGYHKDWFSAKMINLLGCYKPYSGAYLPRRADQIEWLLACVRELCKIYEIPNAKVELENWRKYAESHTAVKQILYRERGVLLGSRNNLQNRKLAVNFLQQEKEVIAITHGEVANSVMDEPPFGYSERTLCTILIDYGSFDCDGEYNGPLILPKQRMYRNGPVAESIHRPSDTIRLPASKPYRALYIPTTYTGNGLYGPFHIYEDALYRKWQHALFQTFPELTFKAHPKSVSRPPKSWKVERRQLEICINDYELLVFDYFATGSMLALVTDKPVIYFDIGLRRLHLEFIEDLKRRCEYAKIDLDSDMNQQVATALTKFWSSDVVRTNTTISRYSLCDDSRFKWLDVFRSVALGVAS